MKKVNIIILLSFLCVTLTGCMQSNKISDLSPGKEMPLVYDVEDTGADIEVTPVAEFDELSSIEYLPDPFLMANGKRMTSRSQWRERRAEIKAMIEKYGAGEKPGKPSIFEPSLNGNTITIKVGEGDQSFQITSTINRPNGAPADKPIPAIIQSGSLPRNMFAERGIAIISYNSNQVMSGQTYAQGNFMKLYPDSTAGSFVRWAWGISRIIDALEALPEAMIDTKHLAVSGCSFMGKMALYAGAFDERIALTIPHESGGGGTISWRYSDMLEKRDKVEVENLLHAQGGSSEFSWYARNLRKFNHHPDKLPYDQHELIAMIAPRAVLMIESSQVPRMGAEAARIDHLAAKEVYKALGVPDRIGVVEENQPHCSWNQNYNPFLEAFLDKFLLGKEDAGETGIMKSKFTDIDTEKWIPWKTPELK